MVNGRFRGKPYKQTKFECCFQGYFSRQIIESFAESAVYIPNATAQQWICKSKGSMYSGHASWHDAPERETAKESTFDGSPVVMMVVLKLRFSCTIQGISIVYTGYYGPNRPSVLNAAHLNIATKHKDFQLSWGCSM